MEQIFKGKRTKDIETSSETIINIAEFTGNQRNKSNISAQNTVLSQQINIGNFEHQIEKRNRE